MTVVDVTKDLLEGERGTAFDQQSFLFADFDGGLVFNYDQWLHRDMDEMLKRDGKAATLEQALTLPIMRARRSIRRGPASVKVTNWVEEQLFNMANSGGMTVPISTVVAQMTGAMIYRKAYFEKVWKTTDDGRHTYEKLAWRPPSTCRVKRDKRSGTFQGFYQNPIRYDQTDPILFDPEYAFVYIHNQKRNPLDGASKFDVPFWCYQTKQKLRFLWYSFLEGQSLPKTVVRGQSQPEADAGARKLLALRSGGVVGIKKGVEFDTIESSGKGAAQFKEALQWLDSESSGSVLAGFTDLTNAASSGTGSFALSKDTTDFFLMSREADSDEMEVDFNNYVVADLVKWNFGPNEPCPIFEFGPISEDDATQAITLLTASTQSMNNSLPVEFMDELTEKVASYLNLDTNRVREGLERAAKEAKEKAEQMGLEGAQGVAPVAGAVDAAAKMVDRMQNPPQLPQSPLGNQSARPRMNPPSSNPDTLRPRPKRASRNA